MARYHTMSDESNEQPSPDAQVTYLDDTLKRVKEILEAPEWSQELYNKVASLSGEIRGTIIAIISNPTATESHRRRAKSALKESDRMATAANKRHRQYALAILKQQR